MENFIAILIGLIWLAFKYYRKTRQDSNAQSPSAVGQYQDSDAYPSEKEPEQEFEEYIEQFFGVGKTKHETKPAMETTPAWMDEGTAPEIEVSYDSIEYQDDAEIKEEINEIQKEDITRVKEDKHIADDFDLEKAVVYSAILEPRYF